MLVSDKRNRYIRYDLNAIVHIILKFIFSASCMLTSSCDAQLLTVPLADELCTDAHLIKASRMKLTLSLNGYPTRFSGKNHPIGCEFAAMLL